MLHQIKNKIILTAIIIACILGLSFCLFQVFRSKQNDYSQNISIAIKEKNKGNTEKALTYVKEAIKCDSTKSFGFILKGQVEALLKNDTIALLDYNKAIQLDNKNVSAYFYKGLSFSNLDLEDSAIFYFNSAINLKTKDDFYVDMTNNENLSLEKQFDIPVAEIFFYRGISYLSLNSFDKAVNDFLFSKTKGYEVAWSNYYLGIAHINKSDKEVACSYLNQALKNGCEVAKEAIAENCK